MLEIRKLPLLIQKSWVVFVYAVTISIESIVIEYLTTRFLNTNLSDSSFSDKYNLGRSNANDGNGFCS